MAPNTLENLERGLQVAGNLVKNEKRGIPKLLDGRGLRSELQIVATDLLNGVQARQPDFEPYK
jgi:hypothetical protein